MWAPRVKFLEFTWITILIETSCTIAWRQLAVVIVVEPISVGQKEAMTQFVCEGYEKGALAGPTGMKNIESGRIRNQNFLRQTHCSNMSWLCTEAVLSNEGAVVRCDSLRRRKGASFVHINDLVRNNYDCAICACV